MLSNQRVQFVIFFLLTAFVYAVAHQDVFYFRGNDRDELLSIFDYPLPQITAGAWDPHRLIDHFYSPVWTELYYKYIYGVFYKPFFGEAHFLDVFAHLTLATWGLIFSGFCLISIYFVCIFVKLNLWQMAVYALLFYLFFAQYDAFDEGRNYYNRLTANDLVFLVGLCFLYPIARYTLSKEDVFSGWDSYKAISFMSILCYVAYFSYLFTFIFISIALFSLWLVYFIENYARADFASFASFASLWQKLKAEPKWLLVVSVLSPIFALMASLLGLRSGRLESLTGISDSKKAIINPVEQMVYQIGENKLHYDDKQVAFFIIILGLALGIFVYRYWQKRMEASAQQVLKERLVRWSLLIGGFTLFLTLVAVLISYLQKNFYYGYMPYVRFALVTLVLGYGFKLLQERWTLPIIYSLFFVFSLASVRRLVAIEKQEANSYSIKNNLKVAMNLGYTFSCYGEGRVPFYNNYFMSGGYQFLPTEFGARSKLVARQWQRIFIAYMRVGKNTDKANGGKIPRVAYYYEPSVAKINAKLAELRATRQWSCLRIKNDIYRIEKLDY